MYCTTPPGKHFEWVTIDQSQINDAINASVRAQFDATLRMRILNAAPGAVIEVPSPRFTSEEWEKCQTYWGWYASTLRIKLRWMTHLDVQGFYLADQNGEPMTRFPAYPNVNWNYAIGLFTSASPDGNPPGGVESTIGRHQLYNPTMFSLNFDSYEHADIGMLEGMLAIFAAAFGIQTAFIGDEKFSGNEDRSVGEFFDNRYCIEQTESWWRRWNNYVGPFNSIQSLVGIWHKDELIAKAAELEGGDLAHISSCHAATPDKLWCGNCWKCFLTKQVLIYTGMSHDFIQLTPEAKTAGLEKFRRYQETGEDEYRSCGVLERVYAAYRARPYID